MNKVVAVPRMLSPLGVVVKATCRRSNGSIETHFIRRIKSGDTASGWQWSHAEMQTYFTLDVLDWEGGGNG